MKFKTEPGTGIHIGKLIEDRLEMVGMAKAEFGRRIETSRQNINTLLRKNSIDSRTIFKISKVLKVNFFEILATELETSGFDPVFEASRLKLTLDLGQGKVDQKRLRAAENAFYQTLRSEEKDEN